MDFYIDPTLRHQTPSYKRSLQPASALRILEEVLSPVRSRIPSFRDVILVALDTELMTESTRIREIGIAMLDTSQFFRVGKSIEIQTRMFSFGKSKRSKKAETFWPHRFLFGTTEELKDTDVKDLLEEILTPASRRIVLVGHSISQDCRNVKLNYGMNLREAPSVVAMIDTSPLAASGNNFVAKCISLRDTCLSCGVTPELLHNAGNDAVYTLRTTLLLFKRYKEEQLFYNTLRLSAVVEYQAALLWEYQLEQLGSLGRVHEMVVTRHLLRMQAARKRRRIEYKQKAQNRKSWVEVGGGLSIQGDGNGVPSDGID